MSHLVVLTPEEILKCESIAVAGFQRAEQNGYRDFTMPWLDKRETHTYGACAELAVAKFLGRPWNEFSFKNRKGGDVGTVFEVRSTRTPTNGLVIRPRDLDDRAYILVLTHRSPVYELVGWLWGREGKKESWLRARGHKISPYYMVPQWALREIPKRG